MDDAPGTWPSRVRAASLLPMDASTNPMIPYTRRTLAHRAVPRTVDRAAQCGDFPV
jgi:hypothetical protein